MNDVGPAQRMTVADPPASDGAAILPVLFIGVEPRCERASKI